MSEKEEKETSRNKYLQHNHGSKEQCSLRSHPCIEWR
jgi:hypothetical protein